MVVREKQFEKYSNPLFSGFNKSSSELLFGSHSSGKKVTEDIIKSAKIFKFLFLLISLINLFVVV